MDECSRVGAEEEEKPGNKKPDPFLDRVLVRDGIEQLSKLHESIYDSPCSAILLASAALQCIPAL